MNDKEFFYLDVRQRGNNILVRYIQDGVEKMMKYGKYQPSLYRLAYHGEESEYTELIDSKPVVKETFNTLWDANTAINDASGTSKYYGNRNFNYTFLHEYFKDTEKYDAKKIRVFYLDIECPSDQGFPEASLAEFQIDALTIYDNITDKYYSWSLYDLDVNDPEFAKNNITPDMIVHYQFDQEYDLMVHFLDFWGNNFPVAVSGWFTSGFDLPYIYNRLLRLGLDPNRLSPWGITKLKTKEFQGREILSVDMLGINDLDYLELYKKNRFINRESYKLGFIGEVELGKAKVDFGEEAKNLRTLHKVNPQKYQVYNIVDVQLVKLLDDKLGFMDITFAVAYFAGINYSDVKSPVATWSNVLYRELIDDNVVLPSIKDHEKEHFVGAFVKNPIVGKHKWLISNDFLALYPSLIEQYNISPETITDVFIPDVSIDSMTQGIEFSKPDDDLVVCPSGHTFRRDATGIIPSMMNKLVTERRTIKAEMLNHKNIVEKLEDEVKRRKL
jgi:DNA polymerase elongation subunit (family B)